MPANTISPLDDRYATRLKDLPDYFSERALMKMRCDVELAYLEALNGVGRLESFTEQELQSIRNARTSFSEQDYDRIKTIEESIRHDVKACELYLREKLTLRNPGLIHFGLTSEDVNNLAYSRLLHEFRSARQLPLIREFLLDLCDMAERWKSIPFPARTHGQMASPTTAGKEISVFITRIHRQYLRLRDLTFRGKLNGATGTYAALHTAIPEVDWFEFSKRFVESLGFRHNPVTTQIEDHDTWAEYLLITRQLNSIVMDMDTDCWLYLTLGYLRNDPIGSEVGSSTMPHKINPIRFENSEGNMRIANTLIMGIVDGITQSRMQRDLSDSTVTRNLGVALGHGILGIQEARGGLQALTINETVCRSRLQEHPELLTEPIQTILRREGIHDPYEQLKRMSRGKHVTYRMLQKLIDGLDISDTVRTELHALRTESYTGYADRMCELAVDEVRQSLERGEES